MRGLSALRQGVNYCRALQLRAPTKNSYLWFTSTHKRNYTKDSPPTLRERFQSPEEYARFTEGVSGLMGREDFTSPDRIKQLVDDVIISGNQIVRDISLLPQGSPHALQLMDDLSNLLCDAVDPCEFLRQIHPDRRVQAASLQVCQELHSYMQTLNVNIDLYNSMKWLTESNEFETLPEDSQRTAKNLLLDFDQSGIDLPDELRNKVVKILESIEELRIKFEQGLQHVGSSVTVNSSDIHGGLPHGRDSMQIGVSPDILGNLLPLAKSRSLRKEIFEKAFVAPKSHSANLRALLQKRADLAKLVGYPSYGAKALENTMVRSPTAALEYLDTLQQALEPELIQEVKLLQNNASLTNSEFETSDIFPYDRSYLQRKAMQRLFSNSSGDIQDYFTVGNCMEGIKLLGETLFSLRIVAATHMQGEVWDPSVVKLEVYDQVTRELLGVVYCDLFARPNKNLGAAKYTLRSGRVVHPLPETDEPKYQVPIVAMVCGFQRDKFATSLNFSEAEMLFHEMGHVFHSILARTRYQTIAGTRSSLDFAEFPSTLMEHFLRDYRVASKFAIHPVTGETLPKEIFEREINAKFLFSAFNTREVAIFAKADLLMHGANPFSNGVDTTDLLQMAQKDFEVKHVSETNIPIQLGFGHLSGYASSYYSYLWCNGLASLVWKQCFEKDPWDTEIGNRFRHKVLAHGDGRNPWHMIEDMLGFSPTPKDLATALVSQMRHAKATSHSSLQNPVV
eukprot:m.172580 g.172580  ORF g.172580 m.172580 type:complete len:735 (-) comp15375_c1_seq2:210-2414(-)